MENKPSGKRRMPQKSDLAVLRWLWRLSRGQGLKFAVLIVCNVLTGAASVVFAGLSKGIIDSKKVRVEFSLEDMDMSGFRKGATYQQIKDYVLDHTGLKVSTLYIAQVKQKYGVIERENYNKPKSEDARQPLCPPDKEAAIVEALRHFGMI